MDNSENKQNYNNINMKWHRLSFTWGCVTLSWIEQYNNFVAQRMSSTLEAEFDKWG